MRWLSRTASLSAVLCCLGLTSFAPGVASRAFADAPTAVTVTPTTARNFGDGGPALSALLNSRAAAELADGSLVMYDGDAHTIRRVDHSTGSITASAGSGAVPPAVGRCHVDTTSAATSAYLAGVSGLWGDDAGDIFIWTGGTCDGYGNVYRLSHSGGAFELVVETPQSNCCASASGDYTAFAVDGAGDVFAADAAHAVIRKYAPGASAQSGGVVVAGSLDSPGDSGDGALAVDAQIEPSVLAATSDGTLFLSAGHTIRRVATTGIITTVAGTGSPTPSGQPSADDGVAATAARIDVSVMTIGQDDGNIYFQDQSGGIDAVRAVVLGGTARTVVGPAEMDSGGDPTKSTVVFGERAGLVVGEGPEAIRSWPSNGSAATQPGTRVAGLDDATSIGISADGAPLSDAFLPGLNAIAQSPDGSLALATPTAIRSLSGLGASDTIGTLVNEGATNLAYAAGGTLYFTTGNGSAGNPFAIDVRDPDGSIHTVLGRGTQPLADGELGTDIAMHQITSIALDESTDTLYFDSTEWSPSVWAVNLADDKVRVYAGSANPNAGWTDGAQATDVWLGQPADVAVDPTDHSLVIVDRGPIPTELLRVHGDGTIHDLGCTTDCSYGGLRIGSDGTIYSGGTLSPLIALHPDGSTAEVAPDLAGPFALLDDGKVVGTPTWRQGDEPRDAGGLLAVSDPISDATFSGTPATLTAQPAGRAVTVTVTPPAQPGLDIRVLGSELPTAPEYPRASAFGEAVTLVSFTSDGTGNPQSFTFDELAPSGSSGPALELGHSYRFAAFTTESSGLVSVSSSPSVATAVPQAVAPSAPTTVQGYVSADSGFLQWAAPADDGGSSVSGYVVNVSPACPSCQGLQAPAGQTATTITGLTAGQTYSFSVSAVNDVGTGAESAAITLLDPPLLRIGDFNGDRLADFAVFRASSGTWFVRGQPSVRFGATGDVPVVGDFNGDGRSDFALFRPSSGTWYVHGQPGVRFGTAGDVPAVGDFNGDGRSDMALFRPSSGTWYVHGQPAVRFGAAGDVPVAADYNGDGRSDLAVFRASSGTWFVRGEPSVRFGAAGDVPVPADYAGDHATDVATFRPAAGSWFVHGRASVRFGALGDVPV